MTTPEQVSQEQVPSAQPSDKELNFRKQQAMYERQLDQERQAREQLQRELEETRASKTRKQEETDDDDDQPYVDHKRLARQFSSFEQKMEAKIDKKAEEKARGLLEQERKENYLKQNPDFWQVLQHAEKFAEKAPDLADSILAMPESFERQKLVYKNIKALGIDKPESKPSSIQDKIDSNRRSPYYQPSGVGTAPYGGVGAGKDYSPTDQKNAYAKMQELKNKLRI